ncbi:MAG: CCA tRNA nucleotidyltransferase [Candidatus Omnitrophica bacterium]|nr:CCA tRNA nucleotidyltransferase [Candidatus Omnitrophota bacterium]
MKIAKKVLNLLKEVEAVARENGAAAYLVGGPVRDLLLNRGNLDLDVVIEGDAAQIAKSLVDKKGGTFVVHKRFGTATVTLKNGIKIDLATARKEYYGRPAALPTVEFSTVIEDLYRRDFTINAMAIDISKKQFGRLLDFFGGEKDLAGKKIRVIHDQSFIDDPTRILRAVRFEQRLGFKIEDHTEGLIKASVKRRMLEATGKERLRDELILMLKENEPGRMIKRLQALAGLGFIHPKLRFTKKSEVFFNEIKKMETKGSEPWLIYLTALLDGLSLKEAADVARQFVFKKNEQERLLEFKKESAGIIKLLKTKGKIPLSRLRRHLEPISLETLLAIMVKGRSRLVNKRISIFLSECKGVALKMSGEDLKKMGLPAGPRFKRILDAVLDAKLDKGFKNKAQEMKFARRCVKNGL